MLNKKREKLRLIRKQRRRGLGLKRSRKKK